MIVTATTEAGHVVQCAVADEPTAEDLRRLAAVAAMPGLAGATWTGAPGDRARGTRPGVRAPAPAGR